MLSNSRQPSSVIVQITFAGLEVQLPLLRWRAAQAERRRSFQSCSPPRCSTRGRPPELLWGGVVSPSIGPGSMSARPPPMAATSHDPTPLGPIAITPSHRSGSQEADRASRQHFRLITTPRLRSSLITTHSRAASQPTAFSRRPRRTAACRSRRRPQVP